MIRAYAVSAVRSAEATSMADLPEGELMSRAASGLAAVASARLGGPGGRRVVVLVGAGNNGGDALYAAALLAQDGAAVVVLKVAESAHEGGLGAAQDAGVSVFNAVGVHADPKSVVASALGEILKVNPAWNTCLGWSNARTVQHSFADHGVVFNEQESHGVVPFAP